MKFIKWFSVGVVSLFVLSAIGVATYLYYVLPSVKDIPQNRLVATQALAEQQAVAPYDGPHPSMVSRPKDPFKYPIKLGEMGPVEPIYARHNVYPFWCGRNTITDKQPEIDNQQGFGVPVFSTPDAETAPEILGYSQDCLHRTEAFYYFKSATDDKFYRLNSNHHPMATTVIDGKKLPFVIRVEVGTINRHFYMIAVLKGDTDELASPKGDHWNGRLVYQFRGGVGIGKRQGNIKLSDVLERREDQISQGYGVIYSSANQTSNHYNMWLAEETARRVKSQFVALYGEPLYTVGIGGSGGAIQQYLIAQNNPEILDAIIPLYSYPDMVSQIIYVLDCEPLEYYFEKLDKDNQRWSSWGQRSLLHGLSYDEALLNKFTAVNSVASLMSGKLQDITLDVFGSNECIEGWRGLTPLVHNPNFVHFMRNFSPKLAESIQWTHWNDLRYFYGTDEHGYANSAWDNEGVQYGLESLLSGELSEQEFLKINAKVGGWKYQKDWNKELLWLLEGKIFPVDLSFWSHQNIRASKSYKKPASRTKANPKAIAAAYYSGHVFVGEIEVPILDVRHYLDDELDMHHASASFATRMRIQKQRGSYDNQVIWVSHKDFDPINEAFKVMDDWMLTLKHNPQLSVSEGRPEQAFDTCFGKKGNIIDRGDGVWDGEWNNRSDGSCTRVYPPLTNSREIAGAPNSGDVFKCHLQPVQKALHEGLYGDVDMQPYLAQLQDVFPSGVCDYRLGDAGRPVDLFEIARWTKKAPTVEVAQTHSPAPKEVVLKTVFASNPLKSSALPGPVLSQRDSLDSSPIEH